MREGEATGKRWRRPWLWIGVVAVAALVTSITAVVLLAPPGADPNAIRIENFAFSPGETRVPIGTTVTWTNFDDVVHDVVIADHEEVGDGHDHAETQSGDLETGASWSYTFEEAGHFHYHCHPHPWMEGEIIVE